MKRRSLPPRGVVLRPLVGGAEALASCDRMRGGRGGQRLLLPSLAAFLKFHKLRRPRAGSHTGRLKETSATLEALRFPSQRQRGEAARPEAPRWAEGNKICLIPVLAPPPRRGSAGNVRGPGQLGTGCPVLSMDSERLLQQAWRQGLDSRMMAATSLADCLGPT